jgi:hypothetical protein
MNSANSSFFIVLFLISSFIAIITSYMVPVKRIWIPVVFCVFSGLSIGVYSAGAHPGLFKGMIMGVIFAVCMIPGMRLTRYYRERALGRLKEKGINLEDIFKNH